MNFTTSTIPTITERFDHEVSLISAVAYLCIVIHIGYSVVTTICCRRSSSSSNGSSSNGQEVSWFRIVVNICLLLLAIELPSFLSSSSSQGWIRGDTNDGLADLIQGLDPRLHEILERVPLLQLGPQPPILFRNRHIQFIPWLIQNEIHRRQGVPYQRIQLQVSDCHSKLTRPYGAAHDNGDGNGNIEFVGACPISQQTMNDTITLDVFPPFDDDGVEPPAGGTAAAGAKKFGKGFNTSSPVIIFSPGLRCHSQDLPGTMIVRKAYEKGFRSIVFHRRGHTVDQPLSSPRWNLFGDVNDLEQVYWHIKNGLLSPNTPIFLHGISSGTAVTVTALAKWDKRRKEEPHLPSPSFVASVSITPGYDTSKVLNRERFLFPYNDLLLNGVKDTFVRRNEALLRRYNATAVDSALAARSLQEFVDATVSFAGYEDIADYYRDTNPINHVRDITTPTLILNAIDDPCCKISNLYEESPYPHHDNLTYAEMIAETDHALVAVTKTGSHCPFLSTSTSNNIYGWSPFVRDPLAATTKVSSWGNGLTGGWMLNSWADEVSIEYYRATLEVYGERRFL
jgi:predicted alpha/beta-fold hydrolase